MARRRRRDRAPAPAPRPGGQRLLILDSGAVIALSRGQIGVAAKIRAAREAGGRVLVPAIVLAETLRGRASDAAVHRVLKDVDRFPAADVASCRLAAALLEAAGSAETVDAVVVSAAIEAGGGVILTNDDGDLAALADGHPRVVVARC